MTFIRCSLLLVGLVTALFVHAVPTRADDVTLVTSSGCYELGDTVSFTLTNNLDSTIYMPRSPVWTIYESASDSLVYPSVVLWIIVPLSGNSDATYTWPQTDHHGNAVAAGTYWVEVRYSPQMEPWVVSTVADTFDIKASCPSTAVDPATWGSIKRLFH